MTGSVPESRPGGVVEPHAVARTRTTFVGSVRTIGHIHSNP